MRSQQARLLRQFSSLAFTLIAVTGLEAQNRVVLPEGSVILVRTHSALQSATAQPNQTFETTVIDTVRIDDFTVIPAGSRIRGVMTYVQPATRQRSGVIELSFDRLMLPDGTSYPMAGKLTSTDPAERRQIDANPDPRVVLVGGRGGIGAAIAGAGSERSPASSVLVALGSMLSEGRNVNVPAGSTIAVQLEQPLTLRVRGARRAGGFGSIYTGSDRIRAAQEALAQRNYYRGAATGRMDEATQRALFEFQIDNRITATGNLDGRTAQALGLGAVETAGDYSRVMTADEASRVRRSAQDLLGRQRTAMNLSTAGRLDSQRSYSEAELELWFALSAFADNASLYEQLIRASGNAEAETMAGRALAAAARRVDAAMQRARATSQVQAGWSAIRSQMETLER